MIADQPLAGRVAVVTGASRGIGYQAAKGFAAAGAHVIAVARTVGGLEELDDDIQAGGGAATLVPLDLKDSAGIDRLGAAIFERWGRLDILLANAGVLGQLSPLGHIPPKVWDDVMAVNVTANWRLIRSLDPLLRRSDGGRAVFVGSGAARNCRPYWGPYSVSKAALEASVRYLAADLGPDGIRVNAISAGPIRTLAAAGIGGFKGMYRGFVDIAPLRANITPEDVGKTALYLASDLSSAVTGEVIYVDGGFSVMGVPSGD